MTSIIMKILLIEDNPADAYRLIEMLEEIDDPEWRITQVSRLNLAIKELNNNYFDIMLSDLSLPDSHGLNTIIRLHSAEPNVPIVVLSGLDDKELSLQAVAKGAQDYLVKDKITPEVLLRTMRYAIERGQIFKQLQESEQRFRGIFDGAFQLMALLTPEGILLEINQTALELCGAKSEDLVNLPLWESNLWQDSLETQIWLKTAIDNAANGELIRNEMLITGVGDIKLCIDFSLKPVKNQVGKVTLLIAEGRDISARKRAEAQLQESLQEKEWLLKEIHHRVKNNLNIVSSLLKLQSQNITDTAALALFRESQNRLKTMGLIHEKLYQSLDLRRIEAKDYISKLASTIFDSYKVSTKAISLNLDVADIWIDPDTAIPCGLIINELVTNSLKYAFGEGKKGEIGIKLDLEKDRSINLIVCDNGIGLPANLNIEEVESLGLQLVFNLTEQLGGNLEIDRASGTAFKISFTQAYREREGEREKH